MDQRRKEMYELYRKRVTDEDVLINNRMSWMLGGETISLALWGLLYSDILRKAPDIRIPKILSIALVLVAATGFYIAYQSRRAIRAAHSEIEISSRIFDSHFSIDDPEIPRLTGTPVNHKNGHVANRQAPWFFMIIWSFLFLLSALTVDASLDLSNKAHALLTWLNQ